MAKNKSRGYRSWKTKELKHFLLVLQWWFFIAGKVFIMWVHDYNLLVYLSERK
jgi:hypothetical protein